MNTLIEQKRELRDMHSNPGIQNEHADLQLIQNSYNMSYEDAQKMFEIKKVRTVEQLWGGAIGALAVYKARPILREWGMSYAIWRKAWMRYPAPVLIFLAAYHVATMLPQRLGRKLHYQPQVTNEVYTSQTDLVGRFRLFKDDNAHCEATAESSAADYLAAYSSEAMTEPEMIQKLQQKNQLNKPKKTKLKVKRLGKDVDDVYWVGGKIHGLENIAFLTPEELKSVSNDPVALQLAVNKVNTKNSMP